MWDVQECDRESEGGKNKAAEIQPACVYFLGWVRQSSPAKVLFQQSRHTASVEMQGQNK